MVNLVALNLVLIVLCNLFEFNASLSGSICHVKRRIEKIRPVLLYRTVYKKGYNWRRGHHYYTEEEPYWSNEPYYETKLVEECCQGYREMGGVCQPFCENGCIGGTCNGNNHCLCPKGFHLVNNNECLPYCEKGCYNGQCTSPGVCTCYPGWRASNGSENMCSPICSKGCINGFCMIPDVCGCYAGYRLNSEKPFICDPVCETDCINATCAGPNICSCWTGYKPINENECEPSCLDHCNRKGECISPGVCSCQDGYNEPHCLPNCPDGCDGGNCVAPGVCICPKNYLLKNGECKPICEEHCIHSYCVAPNTCDCHKGYLKANKYSCQPDCGEFGCINSKCLAPNYCECYDGYLPHPFEFNICLPSLNQTKILHENSSKLISIYDDHVAIHPKDEPLSLQNLPIVVVRNCLDVFPEAEDEFNATCQFSFDNYPKIEFLCELFSNTLTTPTEITSNTLTTFAASTPIPFSPETEFTTLTETSISDATEESFPIEVGNLLIIRRFFNITNDTLSTDDETKIPYTSESVSYETSTISYTTPYYDDYEDNFTIPEDSNNEIRIKIYVIFPPYLANSSHGICKICISSSDPVLLSNDSDTKVNLLFRKCPQLKQEHVEAHVSNNLWIIIITVLIVLTIILLVTAYILIWTSKGQSYRPFEVRYLHNKGEFED